MNKSERKLLKEGERLDDLHRNNYKIIQNPNKFCFGQDAVLLSHFAEVAEGEKVIDIGSGTGIIPILLAARTKGSCFYGVELQEDMVEMSKRSVLLNELSDKIFIKQLDANDLLDEFQPLSIDVVVTNPPYIPKGKGIINDHDSKTIARHEITLVLRDLIRNASKVLKHKGRFYIINKPSRLVDIFVHLRKNNLEPKALRLIHPFASSEPTNIMVEAVKGGKPFLKVMKPLVVYNDDNSYTDEIMEIYYGE